MTDTTVQEALLFVGTYTRGRSEGIYVYRLQPDSGALSYVAKATGIENPSYLAVNPRNRCLYAVSEVDAFQGRPGGGVYAYAIDARTGGLSFLNAQPSQGTQPCYITVDFAGRHALVANYGSGSVAVLPIEDDGRLSPASETIQHQGSGPNPERQEGPHAHCILPDLASARVLVADLGLDRVMVYRYDAQHGRLDPGEQPWIAAYEGAGPRHLTFDATGRYLFAINELNSTLTAYTYHDVEGVFTEFQTIATLPEGYDGTNYPADVHVLSTGRFVYGSNRGHDSIVGFSFDEDLLRLDHVDWTPTGGQNPRGFVIDPTGAWLLVANQDSDNVVVFRIDPATGRLEPTGTMLDIPSPVCLKWLSLPA
ncbi:MAG: lactonase family protein [Anaerolineae bacterium]